MIKVILVRHAETEWNASGMIQGHSDSAVTHRGLREASALLATLVKNNYPIDAVYSSPLGRAWHMGQILAEGFHRPLMAEPALKEQAFGCLEGISSECFSRDNPKEAQALFAFDANYCPPGGESLAVASGRIMQFLEGLQRTTEHHTICLVSHGHVSQGVLAMLKEGRIDNFARYAHPNASYSVFELRDGKCLALKWGIATHLVPLQRHDAF